jgi:hypothetical protein
MLSDCHPSYLTIRAAAGGTPDQAFQIREICCSPPLAPPQSRGLANARPVAPLRCGQNLVQTGFYRQRRTKNQEPKTGSVSRDDSRKNRPSL